MYVRHPWIYPLLMSLNGIAALVLIMAFFLNGQHLSLFNIMETAALLTWSVRITTSRNRQIKEAQGTRPPVY